MPKACLYVRQKASEIIYIIGYLKLLPAFVRQLYVQFDRKGSGIHQNINDL